MKTMSGQLWRLALALLLVRSPSAKDAPTALEASYKERIQALLGASAHAAAGHLAKRLALGDTGGSDSLFGGYELELGEADKKQELTWLHKCPEVDGSRDSIENCALRQLQALTALCDVKGYFSKDEAARQLVERHLTQLMKLKKVTALGISLQSLSGASFFVHQKRPGGSADDVDASPSIQASALMAVVRCGEALGKKEHLDEAESWFIGLDKVYPQSLWNQSLMSFHRSGIMWESLAVTAAHVGKESNFYEELQAYLVRFEAFLRQAWEENLDYWSFASARALALRWSSKGLKKKQRATLKRWAKEHVDRFLGRQASGLGAGPEKGSMSDGILARIGGARYTCGPLQGLTSLAAILNDPELIQVVLKLLEKDVARYQISALNSGPLEAAAGEDLTGAFFRDDEQLKMEKRRSLRVDDTAMCLVALTQALDTLESIQGVVVSQGEKKAEEPGGRHATEL